MRKAAYGFLFFLLAAHCLSLAACVWACPSCSESLASQSDPVLSARLTQGYARSIYLMMSAPYLVFAGVTLLIVRSARRPIKR